MQATLVVTADHGMKAKHDANGDAQIVYLQSWFDQRLGDGAATVILPITDPYVVHHGALGSFATVYWDPRAVAGQVDQLLDELEGLNGVSLVLEREDAALHFELPEDRIGDIVVVSATDFTLGARPDAHDLSALDRPLRSHGGTSEQKVPLLVNRPTPSLDKRREFRNFDAFDIALNHAQ